MVASLALGAVEAQGEFRCSSDVSYTWNKTVSAPGDPSGGPPPSAVPTGAAVTPPAAAATVPSLAVVRLMSIERGGPDEQSAKAAVQIDADRQRIRASEACKRDHESFGTCVALKMGARSSVLNSLGFSARTELEKALAEECRQQQGTCISVEVTEPKCREVSQGKPAAAAPAEGEKKPDKKADAKKK